VPLPRGAPEPRIYKTTRLHNPCHTKVGKLIFADFVVPSWEYGPQKKAGEKRLFIYQCPF
jgi:hypothetical protein